MKQELRLKKTDTLFEKWPSLVIIEGILGFGLFIIDLIIFDKSIGQIIISLISYFFISLFVLRVGIYIFNKSYKQNQERNKKLKECQCTQRADILLESGQICSWQFSINAGILKLDENSNKILGSQKDYYTFSELSKNKDLKRIMNNLMENNIDSLDDEVFFPYIRKWFIVRGRCIDPSDDFRSKQFIGVIIDNTERRNHLKQVEILSTTDELTGLKNRRYFFEMFNKELNHFTRSQKVFTVQSYVQTL